MPRQSEIDRMIVLIYHSNNAHGFTNFKRSIVWLDDLPMVGLEELSSLLSHMKADVENEIVQRKADGIPKYSRRYHNDQEAKRAAGEELLAQIGVPTTPEQEDG